MCVQNVLCCEPWPDWVQVYTCISLQWKMEKKLSLKANEDEIVQGH